KSQESRWPELQPPTGSRRDLDGAARRRVPTDLGSECIWKSLQLFSIGKREMTSRQVVGQIAELWSELRQFTGAPFAGAQTPWRKGASTRRIRGRRGIAKQDNAIALHMGIGVR